MNKTTRSVRTLPAAGAHRLHGAYALPTAADQQPASQQLARQTGQPTFCSMRTAEGEVLDVLPVLVGLADISGDGKHLRGGVQICEGLLCYIHVHVLYSLLDIGHEKVHTKSYETLMFHRVPYEIDHKVQYPSIKSLRSTIVERSFYGASVFAERRSHTVLSSVFFRSVFVRFHSVLLARPCKRGICESFFRIRG